MRKAKSHVSKADGDDMRDHYDFSGGVRAKYAARYADGVTIVIGPEAAGSAGGSRNKRPAGSRRKTTAKATTKGR